MIYVRNIRYEEDTTMIFKDKGRIVFAGDSVTELYRD